MAITLRSVKGSGLTNDEIDANFTTLDVKDLSGGVAGLTLFKLNLRNAANTFTSFLTNAATAARTWTMPDKDGTVALTDDITGGTRAGSFTTLATSGVADCGSSISSSGPLTAHATSKAVIANDDANNASIRSYGAVGTVGTLTAYIASGGNSPSANPQWKLSSAGFAVTGPVSTPGIAFPATQVASANANTLDYYLEASYTATVTGMTTAPTATVSFVRNGNAVTLTLPNTSGVSNATTFTLTGGPTTMRPSSARTVYARVSDNGGPFVLAIAIIGTDGTITFKKDANSALFTAAGDKGTYATDCSYTL